MDDITRGHFSSYEQGETAPPWSVGWLANSTGTTVKHHIDDEFCGLRGEIPQGNQGHNQGHNGQTTKLFVGMAPKSAYEADFRAVFAPFGRLVDIYVIRDRNGFSKGCAFVRYESVKSANDAIEALHDKHIMPGGFRTLVVTIADDRRGPQTATSAASASRRDASGSGDGLSRCLSRPSSFTGSDGGGGASTSSFSTHAGPTLHTAAAPNAAAAAYVPTVAPGGPSSLMSRMPYFLYGSPPHGTYVYYPYIPSSSRQQDTGTSSVGPVVLGTKPHHAFPVSPSAVSNNNRGDPGARGVHEDGQAGNETVRRFGTGGPEEKGRRWAKQFVGPTGANLFVYYLPGSLTDADLATAFAPFGEVLSAKVYYDRDTLESKGFGFVSYTKPEEADAAISGMNGFFIGQKRLKVVRKRGQQTVRCPDNSSNSNSSGRVSDPAYAVGDGADGGSGSGTGSVKGFGNASVAGVSSGERSLLGAGLQGHLDSFTPEGLLGQSMARFL